VHYTNPVIPGFYPDPSVCRVGNDYFLATSSFEYFPGVPIFTSRDLVHWRQIGHCLTRESQLSLDGVSSSGGIYAPTLRYHDGWFYMVTTNMQGGGHFYVRAQAPTGPWSDPVWIERPWFDPDLFWDNDGSVYFSWMSMGHGISQQRIDLDTGALVGPERTIWPGFEDPYCEAPHVYKIGNFYYLIVAEGGTHRSHMIACARSESATGPYIGCPHNPLLTHRCAIGNPIEHTGHGDLVQAPDGAWWILFLAVRPHEGRFHLGRETFLAPVSRTDDGWPVINDGKLVNLEMDGPGVRAQPWPAPATRDTFDSQALGLPWSFRRNPAPGSWSLTERSGLLRLWGQTGNLSDSGRIAFLGQRQRHFACQVRTALAFQPEAEHQEAGLCVIMNEGHHYEIALTMRQGHRCLIVRRRIGDLKAQVALANWDQPEVVLAIDADAERYTFSYGPAVDALQPLATGQVQYLTQQVAGGFTGVFLGVYATGNGEPCPWPADYDWFEYRGLDQ